MRSLIINSEQKEMRVALMNGERLEQLHIFTPEQSSLVGNLYKARVQRILPGLEAAFVDYGDGKNGFLALTDVCLPRLNKSYDNQSSKPTISQFLYEGQHILVQITKDPIDEKGARLTMKISLASRYLVFLPFGKNLKVSHLIEASAERDRLQQMLRGLIEEKQGEDSTTGSGYILRSQANAADRNALSVDLDYLYSLWSSLRTTLTKTKAPHRVYRELSMEKKLIRQMTPAELDQIVVDNQQAYNDLVGFCRGEWGTEDLPLRCDLSSPPLFHRYGVEQQIEGALARKINLDQGGYIVIDQTEAMVVIDVNTGSSVGQRCLDKTHYETNLQAAKIIAHQIRLRNLSGIIVIDFIDMKPAVHRNQLLSELKAAMINDGADTYISNFTEFGLVQMRRTRRSPSLGKILAERCSICSGSGEVRTLDSVFMDIWRRVSQVSKIHNVKQLELQVSLEVMDYLQTSTDALLEGLEQAFNCIIELKHQPRYPREHFNVVPVRAHK